MNLYISERVINTFGKRLINYKMYVNALGVSKKLEYLVLLLYIRPSKYFRSLDPVNKIILSLHPPLKCGFKKPKSRGRVA